MLLISMCDMDKKGIENLSVAVHGDSVTTGPGVVEEREYEMSHVRWLGPYPSLCYRKNGDYPLGFKPSMIQMSEEDADWMLSQLEAGELTPSTQRLTTIEAKREAEIRLAHRDRRIIKTSALVAGKTHTQVLNMLNYLLDNHR